MDLTAVLIRRRGGGDPIAALALQREGLLDARQAWPRLPIYRPREVSILQVTEPEFLRAIEVIKRGCAEMGEGAVLVDLPPIYPCPMRYYFERLGQPLQEGPCTSP